MLDTDKLRGYACAWGITLPDAAWTRMDTHAAMLAAWNTRMNLTAVTDPEEMLIRHYLDSLSVLTVAPREAGAWIDIGTGAGFPGVPLALARPDARVTLLDAQRKRLEFLDAFCKAAGTTVSVIHARAEEGGRRPALREQFDLAAARAVAALPVLAEWCLPYVRVGGVLVAMKGPEEDGQAAEPALAALGGALEQARVLMLPDGRMRRLLVIRKLRPTPCEYPRRQAQIAKKPLA